MQGEPFKYFAYGAAAAEVEVDGFTGAYRLRRADVVHDVGDSLSPLVDLGQIEGGFVQGVGWLTLEELLWDETDGPHRGRLNTQAASTYKIPSFSGQDAARVQCAPVRAGHRVRRGVRVQGGRRAAADGGVQRARGAAAGGGRVRACLLRAWSSACPSTPEAVYWAVQAAKGEMPLLLEDPAPRSNWSPAPRGGPDDGLAQSRAAATGRRPAGVLVTVAEVRGHAPREPRREDGGQPGPHLGQRRRRQPGGDRRRPGRGS